MKIFKGASFAWLLFEKIINLFSANEEIVLFFVRSKIVYNFLNKKYKPVIKDHS